MKRDIFVLVLLIILSFGYSKKVNAQEEASSSNIVGKVGGHDVRYQELVNNFTRNLIEDKVTLGALKEFLPSYLHYKAKILEAKELGYFDNTDLKKEFNVFAKQSAYSYWLQNKIKPENFEKYFRRYQTEISASHILISLPENASPEDTLYAYNQLKEAREKWIKGASFSTLNKEYSTMRKGNPMGGNLPWFSVGVTVKEFEDIVFELHKGEISMPFRTKFGYHIVKINAIRRRTLSRLVSHIFVRPSSNKKDSIQVTKIQKARKALENGKQWDEVVRQFSEDNLSIPRGGQIGWINYNSRYNTDFVNKIMKLELQNKYSEVVSTSYGYHIFKIDSVQSYSSEQQKRELIQRQFEDTPYYQKNNQFVVNWIRRYYGENINEESLGKYKSILQQADSIKIQHVQLRKSLADEIIYQFNGGTYTYTVSDFHKYVTTIKKKEYAAAFTRNWFKNFVTQKIDDQIVELTLDEFPDFKKQLDTYEEGLAVFEITDDYVWNAATVDTSRLYKLYDSNPENYSLEERKYYHLIAAKNDTTLEKAIQFIREGYRPDSIGGRFNSITVMSDSTGVFKEPPFDKLEQMKAKQFSEKFEFKKRISVFYLEEILPPRKMTFEEAFNKLLTDFQPVREKEWLEKLSQKYNIQYFPAELEKAFNEQ